MTEKIKKMADKVEQANNARMNRLSTAREKVRELETKRDEAIRKGDIEQAMHAVNELRALEAEIATIEAVPVERVSGAELAEAWETYAKQYNKQFSALYSEYLDTRDRLFELFKSLVYLQASGCKELAECSRLVNPKVRIINDNDGKLSTLPGIMPLSAVRCEVSADHHTQPEVRFFYELGYLSGPKRWAYKNALKTGCDPEKITGEDTSADREFYSRYCTKFDY